MSYVLLEELSTLVLLGCQNQNKESIKRFVSQTCGKVWRHGCCPCHLGLGTDGLNGNLLEIYVRTEGGLVSVLCRHKQTSAFLIASSCFVMNVRMPCRLIHGMYCTCANLHIKTNSHMSFQSYKLVKIFHSSRCVAE
ncbi:hypothetical protein AMECASPLE_028002 [Ameca splendens]|uniref:Uncharacterized protein n=1 Tax=Ameca splendens TaxID=208324 RepID=A0ABV0ZRJ5_9TELE